MVNDYEISTDGKTTWINAPYCIGRFCPFSGEIYPLDSGPLILTKPTWEEWIEEVELHLGIEVPEMYKPEWCK